MDNVDKRSLRRLAVSSINSTCPAISVVIPMYNAEEFIGECLESILNQTFQNFEVIVVDDCSTDLSLEIVESYVPKFDGRLRLTQTKVNSGGGGYVPRNIGLNLASGEYVWFVDADDFVLLTALETLYNAAKEHDADIVYTAAHYQFDKPNEVFVLRDDKGKKLFKERLAEEPILNTEPDENLQMLIFDKGFTTPWSKLLRRNFMIENEISFPEIAKAGDHIWTIDLYCHAKRVLRFPTPLYFYRKYNAGSISRIKRTPSKQVSYWVSAFVEWLNTLQKLADKNEILKENPAYCYYAAKRDFEWLLKCLNKERNEFDDEDIYKILYLEFSKLNNAPDLLVPFFFSAINTERKTGESHLKSGKKLREEFNLFKKLLISSSPNADKTIPETAFTCPVISIIIPLYNAEDYIAESFDSILNQTFQNFEVIVVDDCSTDNSYAVVESYIPKFGGRLKLLQMEKNSGSAPAPRNKGFLHSRGEYIFFMDADDVFTKTALEEMYTLAKEYGADVVYCEKYFMSSGLGQDFVNNIHLADSLIQSGGFVDEPEFISDDLSVRLQELAQKRFWVTPWQRLVSRELLAENRINFPEIIGSDDVVWCFLVLCCAKKFLRVPNACYIRRMSDESFTKKKKAPNRFIHQWVDVVVRGLKFMDNFMGKLKFFQENPDQRYLALNTIVTPMLNVIASVCAELKSEEVYDIFMNEFSKDTGESNVLVSFLFTALYGERKSHGSEHQAIRMFEPHITARIDFKLIPKSGDGDFQILSISDDNAGTIKPPWLNKDGIGYMIHSFAGKLKIVAKATADGRIRLELKGKDVRILDNRAKRIPYWIDYTSLTLNDKTIFDKPTPAWHNKPYRYNMNVKAGDEITVEVEWLPHRSDTVTVEEDANYQALVKKVASLEEKLADSEKQFNAEIETLINRNVALQRLNENYTQMIRRVSPYLVARMDLKLLVKTDASDFQITSISDDIAKISQPEFLNKDSVGYLIFSYIGKLRLVAKTAVDGRIQFTLRGRDVRRSEDINKRIPYWIDYTKLIINGRTIFNKLTPAWHNKPYRHVFNVKAGDEIVIQVEWLPHRSDT